MRRWGYFISIDDNEQAQLKVLCDEVFGEENFIEIFTNRSNPRGNQAKKLVASEHDYILCFAKNKPLIKPLGFGVSQDDYNKVDSQGKPYREMGLRKRGAGSRRIDAPNQFYPIYYNPKTYDIRLDDAKDFVAILPKLSDGSDGRWRWSNKKVMQEKSKLIVRMVKRNGGNEYDIFEMDYFSEDKISKIKSIFSEKEVNTENATEEQKALFGYKIFDYPKPVYTIQKLLTSIGVKEGLFLDFFAGSGATAHAVMQLNGVDDGNRQFICVQIDEPTNLESEAYKAGYKTIFDITQARISKAGAKIQVEYPDFKGDLGFKMFETLPMFDKYLDSPDELTENLELFDVNTLSQADRHNLMLTWALRDGIKLGAPLTPVTLGDYTAYAAGKTLYFVEPDISLDAVVALLEQLDNNPDFSPSRLVVLGYLLDSKAQREMTEAVKHYNNRKGIELTLDIRYN